MSVFITRDSLFQSLLKPVSSLQRMLLAALFLCIVAFAGLTTVRSAYSVKRHTDADVYFRAAWAVQVNKNIYQVTDDNGWHYHYPPLLATLLVPLADPPHRLQSEDHPVPYPLAVLIWYVISVVALASGVHLLAKAVEVCILPKPMRQSSRYSQAWWAIRVLPFVVCAEPAGHSLGRGQVTPLVVLAIAIMTVGLMRKQNSVTGLSLAAAICLKVFPAYLLLVPLVARKWSALLWTGLGMLAGLFVIPGLISGFAYNSSMLNYFFTIFVRDLVEEQPGARSGELFNNAFGDLMSFGSILFKISHLTLADRPAHVPVIFAFLHIAISIGMTVTSLWSARAIFKAKHRPEGALAIALLVGVMITAAVPMVPTAQSHYFILSVILIVPLLASLSIRRASSETLFPWTVFFGCVIVLGAIREIPGFHFMTDIGAPVWSGILLWFAGIIELRRLIRASANDPGSSSKLEMTAPILLNPSLVAREY